MTRMRTLLRRALPGVDVALLLLLCLCLAHTSSLWVQTNRTLAEEETRLGAWGPQDHVKGDHGEDQKNFLPGGRPPGGREAGATESSSETISSVTPEARAAAYQGKGGDDGSCVSAGPGHEENQIAAVIVLCHDRPGYLSRSLETLERRLRARSISQRFPVYVSQDGEDKEVSAVVDRFSRSGLVRARWTHSPPAAFEEKLRASVKPHMRSYHRIARHYKFALSTCFSCLGFPRTILVEDDLVVSADFFPYFAAAAPLLDRDPTLYAASAWNDNAVAGLPRGDPAALQRTDFFPGLGWMVTRRLWREVEVGWPEAFWDEYMRSPHVRLGRQVVQPEVSRTVNIGERGASSGEDYHGGAARVRGAEIYVNFVERDLSLLADRAAYRNEVKSRVARAEVEILDAFLEERTKIADGGKRVLRDAKVEYASEEEHERALGLFGLPYPPRGSFEGVTTIMDPREGRLGRVHIAPVGYGLSGDSAVA